MITVEQIVALLVKKFPGMRKDALQNMAGVIALQVEDESAAQTIVDQMTAENVQKFVQKFRSDIDREIQQSNQTLETNLRNKYNFVEKQQQQQQQQLSGPLTFEQLQEAMNKVMAPLTQRLDAIDQKNLTATRREMYVGKLKEAKLSDAVINMMTQQFDLMKFETDEAFNTFLESSKPNIDALAQQNQNETLRNDRTPGSANTNEQGVSQAVLDYLNRGESNNLGGKAV